MAIAERKPRPSIAYVPIPRSTWWRAKRFVYFECPECGKEHRLALAHWPLDQAGKTDLPWVCYGEECGFADRLHFEGWAG